MSQKANTILRVLLLLLGYSAVAVTIEFNIYQHMAMAASDDYSSVVAAGTCRMCNLRYENFSFRKLSKIDLSGAYLFGTDFSWSRLNDANFESAVLTYAHMEWSDFDRANFAKASMEATNMSHATFRDADLHVATLDRADLSFSVLTGANLFTASLIEAQLIGAEADNVNMRGADLLRANLSKANLRNTYFGDANMVFANLSGARFNNANFVKANMEGVSIIYSNVSRVNFRLAQLNQADFHDSVLNVVNFSGCSLRNASFTGAALTDVIFDDADLCGAKMPDGSIGLCALDDLDVRNAYVPTTLRDTIKGQVIDNEQIFSTAKNGCPEYRSNLTDLTPIVVGVLGNQLADITNGKPRGVVAEATIKILEGLGYEPHLVLGSVDKVENDFRRGTFDVGVGMFVNNQLDTSIDYSDSIIREYSVLLTRAGENWAIESFDDLRGVKLGILAGHQYLNLENQPDSGILLVRQRKDAENIRGLLLKELDMVVLSSVSNLVEFRGESIMRMRELALLKKAVGFVDIGSAFVRASFPTGFIGCFNRRLRQFMQTPEWDELLSRNGIGSLVKTWSLLERSAR
jgi:uncharacterized protein YjbI with pentapeptide repeats